jgi:hypothetical protein
LRETRELSDSLVKTIGDGKGVATRFATRPPTAERARRLRALDEQALGLAA